MADLLRPAPDGEYAFPVYSSFEDIAPLFEQRNDTTYVINFWATWCKPCVEELPFLVRLGEEYRDKPVRIILVSLDFEKDLATKLPAFIESFPLPLPVVALTDKPLDQWASRLDADWNGTIPVTVIYKNGLRFFVDRAFKTYPDLQAQVDPLLGGD